jgi:hypothetical protein
MQQNGIPLDDAQIRAIGRIHLAKALLKAIPKVGDIINEMVFERAKTEANAQDKAMLDSALSSILSNQSAQNTDLGDLLNRVDQQSFQMQQVGETVAMLARYFQGRADEITTQQVEAAAVRALPGYTPGDTNIGTLDRYALSKAIEEGLEPSQLQTVIDEIPRARKKIPPGLDLEQQTSKLLNWAECIDGPGLDKIYSYIKRRYANFQVHP